MTTLSAMGPMGRGSLMRTTLAVLLASGAAVAAMAATGARAQSTMSAQDGVITDFTVKYDQSQILELSRPAAEVIVGNPIIADVQVQSGTIMVITGKTFGITNLIILDAERKKIAEHRLIVVKDETRALNVWRATRRQSMNCVPGQPCNPSLVIGDDPDYFKRVQETAKNKMDFSTGGGGGGGGAGGGGDSPAN